MATFTAVRDKTRATVCINNAKQIGIGIAEYMQDHDETLPLGATTGDPQGTPDQHWYKDIESYIASHSAAGMAGKLFVCPARPDYDTMAGGYGINSNLVGAVIGGTLYGSSKALAKISEPIGTFIVCDAAQLDQSRIAAVNADAKKWLDIQTGPSDFQATPPSSFDGTENYYTDPPDENNTRRPIGRHQLGMHVIYIDGHVPWASLTGFLGPLPNGWPYGDRRNTWDDK